MISKIFKIITKILGKKGLYKYPIVQRSYKKFRSVSTPKYSILFGNKIFLGKGDYNDLFIKGESYEKETSDFMIENIHEGDNVVDVGANIGFFTLLMGKLTGGGGLVYSFEPELNNFNLLKKNIEVNKFRNIVPIQKVISDKNGVIRFVVEDDSVIHHIDGGKGAFTKQSNIIELDSITLDSHINKPIKLVKIDVEGHEIEVLNGMKSIIKENKGLQLIVEFSIGNQRRAGYPAHQLLSLLNELKFDLFDIRTKGKITLPISEQEILKLDGINILCEKTAC